MSDLRCRNVLKSIKFKLPIIEEDMEISLDNDTQVETVVCLSREKADDYVRISVYTKDLQTKEN